MWVMIRVCLSVLCVHATPHEIRAYDNQDVCKLMAHERQRDQPGAIFACIQERDL